MPASSDHLVRNRRILQGNLDEVLLRVLDALSYCLGHFARLAEACADLALLVAHDYEGAEGETAAALDDFGDTVDVNDLLLKFRSLVVSVPVPVMVPVHSSHSFTSLQVRI